MEGISLFLIFLLGGLWETTAFQVTGVTGQTVEITCAHSYASTNVKYFCGGTCRDQDVLIRSSERDSNQKYSIRDEGNTFYVTISKLTERDAGKYWCGVDRVGVDTYNEVVLTVKEGEKTNGNQWGTSPDGSSRRPAYIGAGLGLVVLTLAIALLIFFKRRKRHDGSSSAKVQETVYDTVSDPTLTSAPATNKAPDTSDPNKDLTKTIYSNMSVSSEPQVKQDGLFYSTVSFNKHTGCSSVTPGPGEVTYSTIERTRDEASNVYSNVRH